MAPSYTHGVTKLPPSLQARSDRDAIFEDIAPYAEMSIEERSRVLGQLCEWARDAIESSPNPEAAWKWQDPRSRESLELWRRVVAKARGG